MLIVVCRLTRQLWSNVICMLGAQIMETMKVRCREVERTEHSKLMFNRNPQTRLDAHVYVY